MSHSYIPTIVNKEEEEAFRLWARLEFDRIAQAIAKDPFLLLDTLNAEPSKVKNGMVVLADGTNWNPGLGAGYYGYYGSAWHKLG